jgi:hypothetical protein
VKGELVKFGSDISVLDPDANPSEVASMFDKNHEYASIDKASDDDQTSVSETTTNASPLHDYFKNYPVVWPAPVAPPASTNDDLDNWPGLALEQQFRARTLVDQGEKWEVDRDTAAFLASLLALGKQDKTLADAEPELRDLSTEEPLLGCDPALELERLRQRNVAVVSSRGLHPFELDSDREESLSWPKSQLDLPAEKDRVIDSERLEVHRGVMRYLQALVRPDSMTDAEMMDILMEAERVSRLW